MAANRSPGVGVERAGISSELARSLLALSAADRDTLLLVVWGELSYEEAATALTVPIGTVRSRIARARRRLTIDLRPAESARSSTSRIESGEANV